MPSSAKTKLAAIDLFSGVGGLTQGLNKAGFNTIFAFEIDEIASRVYKQNHKKTTVITGDIRKVNLDDIKKALKENPLHLIAGCPPCQGFSSIRRLNKPDPVQDERNSLIKEFVRFVVGLRPYTFMLENVPGLVKYDLFKWALNEVEKYGYYKPDWKIVNVCEYGIPQNRKRLVLVGSRLAPIKVADPPMIKKTVRNAIGKLPLPHESADPLHRVFPIHEPRIQELINDIPVNGGSRKDLGKERQLRCHQKENVGFADVYGRLSWDDYATTITGGCLNPSKGRFLHPEQNRCISAREALLLQSFPKSYKIPSEIPKRNIALLIGNALPPTFSKYQSIAIKNHILSHLSKEDFI